MHAQFGFIWSEVQYIVMRTPPRSWLSPHPTGRCSLLLSMWCSTPQQCAQAVNPDQRIGPDPVRKLHPVSMALRAVRLKQHAVCWRR